MHLGGCSLRALLSSRALVAPARFGICNASSGLSRAAQEISPSAARPVLDGVRSIVLVELVLPVVGHLAENLDVPVAHDGAPPESGTESETATASGSE
jgi:hypothetical protein